MDGKKEDHTSAVKGRQKSLKFPGLATNVFLIET